MANVYKSQVWIILYRPSAKRSHGVWGWPQKKAYKRVGSREKGFMGEGEMYIYVC
jgi:hypothetical protein